MKTKMLLALWACCALFLNTASASDTEKPELRDTIILTPDTNCKILFIGSDIDEMSSYKRIDTVKTLLIGDVTRALMRENYPKDAKTTHYFIGEDGKRRLKAETEDFLEQGVDVEKEKRSLMLGLFPYAYFIHDLSHDYEIQIYVKDPAQLKSLENYNLSKAIETIKADKKLRKNSFMTELERRDNEWILKSKRRLRNDLLEVTPLFGFGLIANLWSPAAGLDLNLQLTDKYGLPSVRISASLLGYTYTNSGGLDFTQINFLTTYGLKFMGNISSTKDKAKWFGINGGFIKTSEESQFDNRFKFGINSDGFGQFGFGFDIIFLKEKKSVYGMTMLFSF